MQVWLMRMELSTDALKWWKKCNLMRLQYVLPHRWAEKVWARAWRSVGRNYCRQDGSVGCNRWGGPRRVAWRPGHLELDSPSGEGGEFPSLGLRKWSSLSLMLRSLLAWKKVQLYIDCLFTHRARLKSCCCHYKVGDRQVRIRARMGA